MKKLGAFFVFFIGINLSHSQVGIGTTTPFSSLDVRASNSVTPAYNDGLLIPKVGAFSAINPTLDQHSMIVYLTGISMGKPPGFYFWDGSINTWRPLGSEFDWNLNGNSGTDPNTNFLGTTDDIDLIFKRNNWVSGQLTQSNTSFGFGSLKFGISGTNNSAFGVSALYNTTTGSYNVAIGNNSLINNFGGSANTAVGSDSMYANTFGTENTATGNQSLHNNVASFNSAFGSYSLYSNTIGNQNTAIGKSALYSNTQGDNNTAGGSNSLTFNTNGNNNTAFGAYSLNFNVSGNSNAAFGFYSLSRNNTGSFNTALGNYSLYNNETGGYNIAIGPSALYNNLNGTANIAIGSGALENNNANNNIAIGNEALWDNFGGFFNTAIGNESLRSNSYGTDNTALGYLSLRSNTFGDYNSAIGSKSLISNATGNENTANGYSALNNNVFGNQNVAVGSNALFSSTLSKNVAVGASSLYSNYSGEENTGVGYNTQYYNSIGSFNSSLGSQSLISNVNGARNTSMGNESLYLSSFGSDNTANGYRALYSNFSGNYNTALGAYSDVNQNSLSNATAIGYRAYVGANDSMVLGSINGINGATSDVNVGIGTITPQDRLDVNGNIRTSSLAGVGIRMTASDPNGVLMPITWGSNGQVLTQTASGPAWQNASSSTSYWTRSASGQLYPSTVSDNIGIGTGTPNAPLQFSNSVVNRKIVLYDTNNNDNQYYGFGINGGTLRYQTDAIAADHVFFAGVNSITSNELMRIKGTGNVGIGTIAPNHRLDVVGGGGNTIDFRTSGRIWTNSTDGGIWLSNLQDSFMGNISASQFGFWSSSVGWNAFNITKSNGYIGIGTTTPAQRLDVIGKVKITDGTQGTGKVLSSDANGVGTWTTNIAVTPSVTGTFAGGGVTFGNGTPSGGSTIFYYTNVYIDLPVGKWMVFGTYLLNGAMASGGSIFVRTTFSDSNTGSGATSPDIVSGGLISGILAGPTDFGIANGQTVINNTSGVTKRYYMWANLAKYGTCPTAFNLNAIGSSFWSENQLSAIPMN